MRLLNYRPSSLGLSVMLICFTIVVSSAVSATAAKLITTKQIKNSAITTAKLKRSAVTSAKIKNSAVTSAKIKNGTIAATDLAPGVSIAGPIGPQGAKGADGVAGPTNVIVRRNDVTGVSSGGSAGVEVGCNLGEKAIGGGGVWINELTSNVMSTAVETSFPLTSHQLPSNGATPTSWDVGGPNPIGATATLAAYVICAGS